MSVTHPITNLGDIVATSIAADPTTTQPIAIPAYDKQEDGFEDTFATLNNPDSRGQTFTGYNVFLGGVNIDANGGNGFAANRALYIGMNDDATPQPVVEFSRVIPASGGQPASDSHLNVPEHTAAQDYIATTELAQTLNNKTLVTPVIASLKQASSGGTINMPTVASGESATLATTTDLPTLPTNLVTTDGTQTITGVKTITNPVFTVNGHTVTFPVGDVTVDTNIVVGTTLSNATSLLNNDIVSYSTLLRNLINYLQNWISVGNLSMSDIWEEIDPEYEHHDDPNDTAEPRI